MGEVKEAEKEDIFERKTTVSNPWLDPAFNKVESLGGEPGFKVDDIPERLGLTPSEKGVSMFSTPNSYFIDLNDTPDNYGTKNQFLQTDGKSKLSWEWPFWSKAGSTVYYKSGKVAIGHAAAQTVLHILTSTATELRVETSGAHDPKLCLKTTNTAHEVCFALDESAVADHVDFIGQTASVDTYFHVIGKVGQTAKVGVQIGAYRGELICGAAGHVSLKNITADLDLVLGIKDGAVNKTITWDADVDQLKHSAGLFDFHDDNILTTGTLGAGQTTLAKSTLADDGRGLSSIFTLSADPAKSDGIALYTEGHIGAITTDGPTYGGGIWLNIDSGATLAADVRALDIGIYERGADCTGGNAYGLAIHMDFDSTNPPAAIYPLRLNCEVSGATPDALIFAANKKALAVTEGDFPYNNYLKIVVQDGTVYRIPLIKEGAAEFIALHSKAEIRFYDNGNYVGFEAPALGANQIWVLPSADGPANEVLGTDNSGNLIWRTHDELAGFVASEHLAALDEDDLVSNSATNVATQQSIKAYVDALPAGVSTFVDLTDTPAAYAGEAGKIVVVNATPDALEFVDTLALVGLTVSGTINGALLSVEATNNYVWGDAIPAGFSGAIGNICIGHTSGQAITSGDYNVYIGYEAAQAATDDGQNVLIGYRAGRAANDSGITCIGGQAGTQTTGVGVTAIGFYALRTGAAGQQNTAVGSQALAVGGAVSYNTAVGYIAGGNQSTGHSNTYIGCEAGQSDDSIGNIYIGRRAGYRSGSVGCNYNIAIGYESLASALTNINTGNIALGYQTLKAAAGASYNMIMGYLAGTAITTGNSNVMIGYNSGLTLSTGDSNVFLGHNAGYHATTGDGNVCIGYNAGETNLVGDSNELWIANSNTATPLIYGEFPNTLLQVHAPFHLGADGARVGAITLWDGAGGNTPGYAKIHSPDGTAWYVFVEDDGTVKIHNGVPTVNADGDAIGDQTD